MSALREKRKKKSSLLLATPTIGYSRTIHIFLFILWDEYEEEEKGEIGGDKWMWEGEIECFVLWWSPDCVGGKWAATVVAKEFMTKVHGSYAYNI